MSGKEQSNEDLYRTQGKQQRLGLRDQGYFPDKDCSIIDTKGNVVAQASRVFVCELVH